jgi:TrmH family RNA methyltransferase
MTARDLEVVRSAQNPLVQRARAVLAGKEPATIALQGDRLVDDAIAAGVGVEVVLLAHDRVERAGELTRANVDVRLVDASLMERVNTLATSPGIVALAPTPLTRDLATLELAQDAVALVVAGISDPGNLGALARAAEAFGAAAFVVIPGGASPWNEKSLRGSMGSLLRVPVVTGATAEAVSSALTRRSVHNVRAATRDGADPRSYSARGPIALWISGETGDLPPIAARFDGLTIPMRAGPESLNVTVAASILLYELGRRSGG